MRKLLEIKDIKEMYGKSNNFWRTHLCRAEFAKHIIDGKYVFIDSPYFRIEVRRLLKRIKR